MRSTVFAGAADIQTPDATEEYVAEVSPLDQFKRFRFIRALLRSDDVANANSSWWRHTDKQAVYDLIMQLHAETHRYEPTFRPHFFSETPAKEGDVTRAYPYAQGDIIMINKNIFGGNSLKFGEALGAITYALTIADNQARYPDMDPETLKARAKAEEEQVVRYAVGNFSDRDAGIQACKVMIERARAELRQEREAAAAQPQTLELDEVK